MRCPNCGKKLNDVLDLKSCSYCGTKIKRKVPMDLMTIVLLCITVVLFVVFLYVVYDKFLEDKIKDKFDDNVIRRTPSFSDDNYDTGNTMGNLQNGGLVAESEDYVYFIAITKKKDITLQRRSKSDPSNIKKVADGSISNISVMSDAMYFIDKDNHLSKIEFSGNNRDLVRKVAIETNYTYAVVVGDWIYYTDSGFKLHKIRPDGSKVSSLSEGQFKKIQAVEDMIYGINGSGNIVYIDAEGENEKTTDLKAKEFVIYDKDWIYYLDDEGIYRAETENFAKEKISNAKASNINIYEDTIYYFDKDAKKVFSMDLEGTNVKEVVEFNANAIFVTETSLFLRSAEDNLIYEYKFEEDEQPKLVI